MYENEESKGVNMMMWIVIGIILFFALFIFFGAFTTIDQTERGVVLRFGEVTRTMEPGFNWKAPFVDNVVTLRTSTQKIEVEASAASADLQTVTTNVALQYNLDPTKVAEIYSEYKTSVRSVVIDPAIQDAIKEATAKFSAEELITKRSEVKGMMEDSLRERLAEANIRVTNLDIANFNFSADFNNAIEQKQVQEQEAQKQVNITKQEEEKKKQEILKAEAIAEKTRLEVQALAAGSDLIEKIKAEAQLKAAENWNGVLPTHMYGSAPIPLINI